MIISDNGQETVDICRQAGLPTITHQLRKQWISQQAQDIEHIVVRVLNENTIPRYPSGWTLWCQEMRNMVSAGHAFPSVA